MRNLNIILADLASVPATAMQPVLTAIFRRILRRHPTLFDRLGEHRSKTFAFLPTGSPYVFLVCPALNSIRLAEKAAARNADVAVSGDAVLLLALLEGRIDGDAIFFSRDLSIAGDIEAVVALRNSLDACGVDLPHDLSPLAGPFADAFAALGERVRSRALARMGARQWN